MSFLRKAAPFIAAFSLAAVLIQPVSAAGPLALKPVSTSDRHFGVAEVFRTQQTDLAANAGVRWSRLTIAWPGQSPGYWNKDYLPFKYMDSQMLHDIDWTGMLIGTPAMYAQDPSQGPQGVPRGLYEPYD